MEAVINIPEVIMDALMLVGFGLIIVALCILIATLLLDIQWSGSWLNLTCKQFRLVTKLEKKRNSR